MSRARPPRTFLSARDRPRPRVVPPSFPRVRPAAAQFVSVIRRTRALPAHRRVRPACACVARPRWAKNRQTEIGHWAGLQRSARQARQRGRGPQRPDGQQRWPRATVETPDQRQVGFLPRRHRQRSCPLPARAGVWGASLHRYDRDRQRHADPPAPRRGSPSGAAGCGYPLPPAHRLLPEYPTPAR